MVKIRRERKQQQRQRQRQQPKNLIRSLSFFFALTVLVEIVDVVVAFRTTTTIRTINTVRRVRQGSAYCLSNVVLAGSLYDNDDNVEHDGLNIAVVGAGPSGLLLSHLLLSQRSDRHRITLVDGQSDPSKKRIEGRAYALGIGIRGRTAIRKAGDTIATTSNEEDNNNKDNNQLWRAVKSRGYESERFRLRLNLVGTKELVIPLRSEQRRTRTKITDNDDEPSLLIYQSELCAALLEELERRHSSLVSSLLLSSDQRLDVRFDTKVIDCDLDAMTIRTITTDNNANTTTTTNTSGDEEDKSSSSTSLLGPFDLIVGCDGVNSQVRTSIDKTFPAFHTTKKRLPGVFKVVRLNSVPSPDVDPTAVSLLIPSGAFIEPTGNDGSCCILFSGRGGEGDTVEGAKTSLPLYLTETKNVTAVVEALRIAFPKWDDACFVDIADQLVAQKIATSAYSITCNTYHYSNKTALVGDAAHATGGVSGQGVNSALMDAVALAECIQQQHQYYKDEEDHDHDESNNLERALMNYSLGQVPEGKALYDLSFGPNAKGLQNKLRWAFRNARDALFRGRFGIGEPPLQTRLSSEMTSFAEIRRGRDAFYVDDNDGKPFPSDREFREQLISLHHGRKEDAQQ